MPAELSRADLLRVLARAPSVPAGPIAELLGWESLEVAPPQAETSDAPSVQTRQGTITSTPVRYLSRPAPVYWRLLECAPLDGALGSDQQDGTAGRESVAEAEIEAEPASPPDPRIAPLLDAGQWQNLWDRLPPSRLRGRAVDLRASLKRLTRAEPLRNLPRQPKRGFNRAVTLILDRPAALRPVWDDMRLAKRSLADLLGDELQTFLLPLGPDGPWIESEVREPVTAPRSSARCFGGQDALPQRPEPGPDTIAEGSLVVLIGAFGAVHTAEIEPDWLRFFRRLRAAGHALLLVALCPLRQTELSSVPLDPAMGRADRETEDQALAMLLAALSQTWLPTPARLRRIRRAIPTASLHTELRAYDAPDIRRDDFHLWLTPDRLWMWLHHFSARIPTSQRALLQRSIEDWRRGLNDGARAIEHLQSRLLDPGPPDRYPVLEAQAATVAAALDRPSTMMRAQLASMLPVLDCLHAPGWQSVQRDLDQLRRVVGRRTVADVDVSEADPSRHSLFQRGSDLIIGPGTGGLLPVSPDAYSLETGQLSEGARLRGLHHLTVIDRGHRWRLTTISRPRWAERIWSDGRRLFAAHADNAILRWEPAALGRRVGAWQTEQSPWPWAVEIGADVDGLWAQLEVRGIPHRLRWIPAGRFLMGSPPDEAEHQDDETLHEVTLSHGFWLGESAVSQALWQAVMGENLSRFKGEDLPVEQVSWEDCQRFITKLGGLLPGLTPALPTEAQWEYACRAGTRTAFSFGDRLDTDRANYDGNVPYHHGPEGEYRQRTLPVRSFRPNPWGLYQMHGNVWEWCSDWYAPYPAGPELDPEGPADGSTRVLRGGSWYNSGHALRSAYRHRITPDDRYRIIGLRLAGGVDRQAGQAGAGALTADGRERSDRPVGGQGDGGEGAAASQRPWTGLLRDWRRRLRGDDTP